MHMLLIAALLAPAADLQALEPTGPWQVDYGDSACMAARQFRDGQGNAQQPVVLVLRPSPNQETTQVMLLRPGRFPRPVQERVVVDGANGPIVTTLLRYGNKTTKKTVSLMTLSSDQFAAVGAGNVLTIRPKTGGSTRLAVRQLARVKTELAKCSASLAQYWAMSPEQVRRIRTEPRPLVRLSSLFKEGDYPAQALDQRNTGTVGVRLMIDERGTVANCATLQASGSALLDAMTCLGLEERAKFAPGIDVDGKPVRSFYDTRISWRIP